MQKAWRAECVKVFKHICFSVTMIPGEEYRLSDSDLLQHLKLLQNCV